MSVFVRGLALAAGLCLAGDASAQAPNKAEASKAKPGAAAGQTESPGHERFDKHGWKKFGFEPEDGRDKEQRERLVREVMDQMRAMRMWKVTEELKLSEAQAAKVFPALAKYDEKARDLGKERHELSHELWKATQADKPDDARLRTLTERLVANRSKRNAIEDERWRAVRPVLSPLQQAKLLLLLPRLEDEFRRKVRQAFEGQRRGPETEKPPGPPRPPAAPAAPVPPGRP